MPHTNFQGHRSFGSRKEIVSRFLPYMSMAAILVMWHKTFIFTFILQSYGGSIWNLASICQAVCKEKKFEDVESEWPSTKVSEWPWPFIFKMIHVLIQLTASINFDIIDYNSFWKIQWFTFFPYKRIRNQIWHRRKIGQAYWSQAVSKEKKFENAKPEWPWIKVNERPRPLIFM